jgi:hypothetical protein
MGWAEEGETGGVVVNTMMIGGREVDRKMGGEKAVVVGRRRKDEEKRRKGEGRGRGRGRKDGIS